MAPPVLRQCCVRRTRLQASSASVGCTPVLLQEWGWRGPAVLRGEVRQPCVQPHRQGWGRAGGARAAVGGLQVAQRRGRPPGAIGAWPAGARKGWRAAGAHGAGGGGVFAKCSQRAPPADGRTRCGLHLHLAIHNAEVMGACGGPEVRLAKGAL